MAITPISSDRNNNRASVVSNMLNRGGRSLSQMLGAAIQLGRNTSDNQFRQEQAFLTEQRRELQFNERRADAQQQNKEDARMFNEDKRRFNVKFDQEERFQDDDIRQKELNRDIDRQQVTGNLNLAKERNEIARQGTAANVFRAETDRAEATARMSNDAADTVRKNKVLEIEAQNNARFREDWDRLQNAKTPEEEQQAALTAVKNNPDLDASTRNRLLVVANLGVSENQLEKMDQLPPARKARADGSLKAIEDLSEKRNRGTDDKGKPLTLKQLEELDEQIERAQADFQMTVEGTRSIANGDPGGGGKTGILNEVEKTIPSSKQ